MNFFRLSYLKIIFLCLVTLGFFGPSLLHAKELKVGDKAPEFISKDDQGNTVSLKDFHGKTVVLYFYPKDNTPGCTVEAKSFRDNYAKFQENNAVVIGVSYDDQASHQAFKSEYSLPYLLLVDKDKTISKAYGADGTFFADRETFVIDPQGNIKQIYRNVNPSQHADEILLEL